MLVVFTIPCNDTFTFGKTLQKEQIRKADNEASHQKDDCSPFCSCNCCSISVLAQTLSIFEILQFYSWSESFTPYKSSKSTYSQAIWQPPKLSNIS